MIGESPCKGMIDEDILEECLLKSNIKNNVILVIKLSIKEEFLKLQDTIF